MDFDEFAEAFAEECYAETEEWLAVVGEEAYDQALAKHQFTSRTGRLLSSIGWGVVRDGRVVRRGGFEPRLAGGAEGVRQGEETLQGAIGGQGVELIFVAGMHYASSVEASGYDVSTAGELIIDELMSRPW